MCLSVQVYALAPPVAGVGAAAAVAAAAAASAVVHGEHKLPHLVLSGSVHRHVMLLLGEVRLAHLLILKMNQRSFLGKLGKNSFQGIPAEWWNRMLCKLQLQDTAGESFLPPLDASFLAGLRSRLTSGPLLSEWCQSFVDAAPPSAAMAMPLSASSASAARGVALAGAVITAEQIADAGYHASTPNVVDVEGVSLAATGAALLELPIAAAVSYFMQQPLSGADLELLLLDPVLCFIDAQTNAAQFSRVHKPPSDLLSWPMFSRIMPLLTQQSAYEPLVYRLLYDMLPRVAKSASEMGVVMKSDRTGAGVAILGPLMDLDRPRGLFSVFSSSKAKYPHVEQLNAVVQAHVLNALAAPDVPNHEQLVWPLRFSVPLLDYWLSELSQVGPKAWIEEHNCRLLLDCIVKVVLLAKSNGSLLADSGVAASSGGVGRPKIGVVARLEQFLRDQASLLCPRKTWSLHDDEYRAPTSILSLIAPDDVGSVRTVGWVSFLLCISMDEGKKGGILS